MSYSLTGNIYKQKKMTAALDGIVNGGLAGNPIEDIEEETQEDVAEPEEVIEEIGNSRLFSYTDNY